MNLILTRSYQLTDGIGTNTTNKTALRFLKTTYHIYPADADSFSTISFST